MAKVGRNYGKSVKMRRHKLHSIYATRLIFKHIVVGQSAKQMKWRYFKSGMDPASNRSILNEA
jgi:hypothetical protein